MNLEAVRHRYLRHVVAPLGRALGVRATTAVARRLSRGMFELNTPDRQRAELRIRAALTDASLPVDAERIAAAMYENLGRFWSEALFIPKRLGGDRWRRYVRIEDEAALRESAESPRGCLLATGYFGNPAVAACALGRIFKPLHVLVDWLESASGGALAAWQKAMYAQKHVRPIGRNDALKRVPDVLTRGGAVLMISEHERPCGRGVPTRFLGATLNAYPTLGRLARWYDAPIAVVTCRRETRPFSFTLRLHDVIEPGAANRSGQAGGLCTPPLFDSGGDDARLDAAIVRRCLGTLEQAIMESPEQYLWSTAVRANEEIVRSVQCEPLVLRQAVCAKRRADSGNHDMKPRKPRSVATSNVE